MAKKRRKEEPALVLKVRGPGVRKGRINVRDLIRLCEEAQNAINRQAEAKQGKKTTHPGPVAENIQDECTLELFEIVGGSAELHFGWAKPQLPLFNEQEAVRFANEVVGELATKISTFKNGHQRTTDIDEGVLLSIYRLSDVVEPRMKRISEVAWIVPKKGNRKKTTAPITPRVRENIAARLSVARNVMAHIEGILEMADFKPKDRKCRIDRPLAYSITCTFDENKEEEIYRLMRKPVRAIGNAELQPYTEKIESLHISDIIPLPSLALGAESFFANQSIAELAAQQDIKPIKNVEAALSGGISEDVDLDDFLGVIYGSR